MFECTTGVVWFRSSPMGFRSHFGIHKLRSFCLLQRQVCCCKVRSFGAGTLCCCMVVQYFLVLLALSVSRRKKKFFRKTAAAWTSLLMCLVRARRLKCVHLPYCCFSLVLLCTAGEALFPGELPNACVCFIRKRLSLCKDFICYVLNCCHYKVIDYIGCW